MFLSSCTNRLLGTDRLLRNLEAALGKVVVRRRQQHTIHTEIDLRRELVAPAKRRKKKKKGKSNKPSYRFVDQTRICVTGGQGGKGSLSSLVTGRYKSRPDGGHGGTGGSVVLVADPKQQAQLPWRTAHVRAQDGGHGGSQDCMGRRGKNAIVRVPCGVTVKQIMDPSTHYWDYETQSVREIPREEENEFEFDDQFMIPTAKNTGFVSEEEWERFYQHFKNAKDSEDDDERPSVPKETIFLADLDEPGSYCVVAKGGAGGFGSQLYASQHGPLPDDEIMTQNSLPQSGETCHLELQLKLIADVGLVGFPNAGKSSLLRALSRATPAVAPYPFTTLHPLVGCVDYKDGFKVRMADIPGLIQGASQGRGCGFDFLRHLERTKALLYMVDAAASVDDDNNRDPVEDLKILVDELDKYENGTLLQDRRAIVVANKLDLLSYKQTQQVMDELEMAVREAGIQLEHGKVMGISAGVTGQGLPELAKAVRQTVMQVDKDRELDLLQERTISSTSLAVL